MCIGSEVDGIDVVSLSTPPPTIPGIIFLRGGGASWTIPGIVGGVLKLRPINDFNYFYRVLLRSLALYTVRAMCNLA